MKEPCCTLYTFLWKTPDGIKTVKVARLTDDVPDDWYEWPQANHPDLILQEIAGIEFADERGE